MLCSLAIASAAVVETPAPRDVSADALDLEAFECVQADSLECAVAAFSELVRRDPGDAFAHMWLGHIAVRQGDLARAEHAFERAVETVEARMERSDPAEQFAAKAKKAQISLSLRRVRERRAIGSGGRGGGTAAVRPGATPAHA